MTIKSGPESQVLIGKRLHEIIESCLEIDVSEVSKRHHIENENNQRQAEIQRQRQADEVARQQAAKARAAEEAQRVEQAKLEQMKQIEA